MYLPDIGRFLPLRYPREDRDAALFVEYDGHPHHESLGATAGTNDVHFHD